MSAAEELREHEADLKQRVWTHQDRLGKPRAKFEPLRLVPKSEYVNRDDSEHWIQCMDGKWYPRHAFLRSGRLRKNARGFTREDFANAYDKNTAAGYWCTTWGWFAPKAKRREWELQRAAS